MNFEDFKIRTFEENPEVKEEYDQYDYTNSMMRKIIPLE